MQDCSATIWMGVHGERILQHGLDGSLNGLSLRPFSTLRLGLNIAYPLKLGVLPPRHEIVAPDLARTPDQGLFFLLVAGF